ncbi:MAG: transcription factor S [Methanobrevibacter sp.]|nr:transcription factor S [Methanobrevibacter sp.]
MEFCPDCGGMMLPFEEVIIDEDNKEDDESVDEEQPTKKYLKCNSCGYKKDLSEDVKEEYSVEKKVETEDTVIMRGDESGMKSTVREICPKCGHDRASYELLQTRSADEAPTRFFTCEKCHHKWRGYD